MNPTEKESLQESLNRYIDGDLSGEEAVRMAAALGSDASLRAEERALRNVRAAVRHAAPSLGSPDAETARLRTMARLRASVESEQWQAEKQPTVPARKTPTALLSLWRPTIVTLAAAATVIGAYLLIPQNEIVDQAPSPTSAASTAVLPTDEEMSLLFDLHDVHGGAAADEDDLLHRHRAATAQAALLERADNTVAERL